MEGICYNPLVIRGYKECEIVITILLFGGFK